MDNVTHTLIGITVGKTLPHRNPKFRTAALWAAVIASNFPDLDFVLKPLTGQGNLGYLLQHRGYTHTVLMTIPIAMISAWLGAKIARMDAKTKYWKLLLLVSWVAALLHIVADSWNEYGVHPLWPFDNRWFYGDAIFIVEPLLWAATLPLAVLTAKHRWAKIIWLALAAAMLTLAWFGPFMTWPVALFLTAYGVFATWAQKRFGGVLPAYLTGIAVLLSFSAGNLLARQETLNHLKAAKDETMLQVVLSPAPSNPFCWRVLAVTRDATDHYIMRRGAVSLATSVFRPIECDYRAEIQGMVPLTPVQLPAESHFAWLGEYRGRWSRLEQLMKDNCRFAALLRFTRAPFWLENTGEPAVAGDLRYDNERGMGFAKISLQPESECPTLVPPWAPPIFFPTH